MVRNSSRTEPDDVSLVTGLQVPLVCVCARLPVESWDWDLLRELLGVLEAEDRVEPALLAREMGRGTGVTGGESSCGRGEVKRSRSSKCNNYEFVSVNWRINVSN